MTRRIPAYFIALALLFTTGWTYKIERPDDYPFKGNLEKREAWQEKALRHARSDLKDLKGGTVLLVADQKLATEAAESEVQQWIGVVKRELGETREVLAVEAAAAPSSSGSYTGEGLPQYVIDCESGGDPNVYNHEGSGAYGWAQVMPQHWTAEGWGYGTSGVCYGLNKFNSGDYAECVRRILGSSGLGAWDCA